MNGTVPTEAAQSPGLCAAAVERLQVEVVRRDGGRIQEIVQLAAARFPPRP